MQFGEYSSIQAHCSLVLHNPNNNPPVTGVPTTEYSVLYLNKMVYHDVNFIICRSKDSSKFINDGAKKTLELSIHQPRPV